jgi:hypothetical protein
MISLRSMRQLAAGAIGTGAMAGAMLFGSMPTAAAAPPAPAATFDVAGPHGGAPLSPGVLPERPGGHGWGPGGGHGGWGHGGGWNRGWGHGGGWGHGWGHPGWGWGHGGWWHPWW